MQSEQPRQSLAPVFLSILTMGGVLLFLILVSGGFFVYVVGATLGMFLVGGIHYLFWGADLDHQTEGDREEARVRQEMEEQPW